MPPPERGDVPARRNQGAATDKGIFARPPPSKALRAGTARGPLRERNSLVPAVNNY